jgi:serine/threonine protein kinase
LSIFGFKWYCQYNYGDRWKSKIEQNEGIEIEMIELETGESNLITKESSSIRKLFGSTTSLLTDIHGNPELIVTDMLKEESTQIPNTLSEAMCEICRCDPCSIKGCRATRLLANNENMKEDVLNHSTKDPAKDGRDLNKWKTVLDELRPFELFDDQYHLVEEGISSGAFGTISLAHGPESSMKLCVKKFTKGWDAMEDKEKQSFVNEIQISVSLSHHNVVRCIGVVFEPTLLMINEWCINGSCIDARDKGVTKDLSIEKRLHILITACRGLTYLIVKKILHLDIAARNILLTEHFEAKITDFGRSHYMQDNGLYITDDPIQPLKWTAPEILLKMICSEKSDVWAFGVAMWEILTEKEPYTEMLPIEACRQVLYKNLRLPLSSIWNVKLRNILKSCWEYNPDSRPKMKQILTSLGKIEKEIQPKKKDKTDAKHKRDNPAVCLSANDCSISKSDVDSITAIHCTIRSASHVNDTIRSKHFRDVEISR